MTQAGDTSIDWDENGNMTLKDDAADTEIDYNWDNKLRSASQGPNTLSIKYDPMGNRVYKASSAQGTRKYIVDIAGGLPTILLEIDPCTSSIMKTYVYANAEVLAQHDGDVNAARYFYLHDRLGSVREIIDTDSVVVRHYTYDSFGKTVEESGTLANPFMFTGQYFDAEMGWYYLRARIYDPQLMRLTSYDPIIGYQEEPLSLHKYLYCENDPINWIDPSGESLEGVLVGADIHNAAVDIACYGVESGKLDYIDFAADLENEKGAIAQASSYWVYPMAIDAILRCATKWLGPGYTSPEPGVFVSPDGERVFRMKDEDILGKHGKGPHTNFDIIERDSRGRIKDITKIHVPIKGS